MYGSRNIINKHDHTLLLTSEDIFVSTYARKNYLEKKFIARDYIQFMHIFRVNRYRSEKLHTAKSLNRGFSDSKRYTRESRTRTNTNNDLIAQNETQSTEYVLKAPRGFHYERQKPDEL